MFDLGDNSRLPSRDLLKISQAFVSHTHMDHFTGFDRLLRLLLGRDKNLSVFGPQGFLKNIEGKLAGYSWNLVDSFNYPLCLQIGEVHSDFLLFQKYRCSDRFKPLRDAVKRPFEGVLHEEPAFKVLAVVLDHKIPCLGFSVGERFHINIIRESLKQLDLEPGPWLAEFKEALYSRADRAAEFVVKTKDRKAVKKFKLGTLAQKIARITPGQKITYITDVIYGQANKEKIVEFARDSDHLFIEAAFLDKDREIARLKHHLTARQAGELAAAANVKKFSVFHFSPRYLGQENLLYQEAEEAYSNFKRTPLK
jgi:ribonuclease Z